MATDNTSTVQYNIRDTCTCTCIQEWNQLPRTDGFENFAELFRFENQNVGVVSNFCLAHR